MVTKNRDNPYVKHANPSPGPDDREPDETPEGVDDLMDQWFGDQSADVLDLTDIPPEDAP